MKPYILVLQFEPRLQDICRRAAESEGFEAFATRDGEEALRQAMREAPAAFVTGVSGTRRDGFEVLRELRRSRDAEELPAIVVSPFRGIVAAAIEFRGALGIAEALPGDATVEQVAESIRRALAGNPMPALDVVRGGLAARRREVARLARIEQLGLEHALPRDETMQRLVEQAAKALGAPMSGITIELQDRAEFLADIGLERLIAAEPHAAAGWPFCRAVVDASAELVVPDAFANPAFARSQVVKDGHVRSYAGAPVPSATGESIATLWVASGERLVVEPGQMDALTALARRVAGELEIRAVLRHASEEADGFGAALGADSGPGALMATLSMTRTTLESLDSGVMLFDSKQRVAFANAAACAMLDLPAGSVAGMSRDRVAAHCATLVENPDEFLRCSRLPSGGPCVAHGEHLFSRPFRRALRWSTRPVMLPSGLGQLTLLRDVSAENGLAAIQSRFAISDPLTGLPNRRGGEDEVARETARAARAGSPLCFVLFDLDGLRYVNRDEGWEAGDRLLQKAARALVDAGRASDAIIRWSGEAFLAVLPGCRAPEARAMAERAASELEAPELGALPGVTISAGVVELRPGESAAEAIDRAGQQLLEAKKRSAPDAA